MRTPNAANAGSMVGWEGFKVSCELVDVALTHHNRAIDSSWAFYHKSKRAFWGCAPSFARMALHTEFFISSKVLVKMACCSSSISCKRAKSRGFLDLSVVQTPTSPKLMLGTDTCSAVSGSPFCQLRSKT
eukprot:4651902-Amphidinium_carterae.3